MPLVSYRTSAEAFLRWERGHLDGCDRVLSEVAEDNPPSRLSNPRGIPGFPLPAWKPDLQDTIRTAPVPSPRSSGHIQQAPGAPPRQSEAGAPVTHQRIDQPVRTEGAIEDLEH
jgi:hypothetical protein